MTRLDRAAARAITRDWAEAFTGFAVWKPLQLLRRLGPVLQGIALDRSSSGDDYLPYAHVHALTREFPGVSLTLAAPLRSRGVRQRIRVADHERDFASAVEDLRAQSPLSLGDAPTAGALLGAYRQYIAEAQRTGLPSGTVELEDLTLIPAALDLPDAVADGLAFAGEIAGRWSEPPWGWADADGWLAHLEAWAADAGRLRETVVAEIHRHKLTKVPVAWPGVLDLPD
jgi:hypothetical protein